MKSKWTVKKVIKEIVILLLMLFVISMGMNYLRQPELKEDLYQWKIVDINNSYIDFEAYKGEPLVVHFWATWCPTCKFEAKNIECISHKYNVVSIAVNSGSDDELHAFMQKNKLHYSVVNDNHGELAKKMGIEVYPTTIIYDAEGKIKFSEVGYTTTVGLATRLKLIN
jgi:thiol-disulfide isomerase/thioredoxin